MDNRDALDFGAMSIPQLFQKLFWPTLLGMVSMVLLNLADGIFVGRGVGSDGLAAVNIAAPIFQISTGIALLFGSGVSIVAAIHMSKGNQKAANINVTQAFTMGLLLMTLIVAIINIFPYATCRLFGGSDTLFPLVREYLKWVSPCVVFMVINYIGTFTLRLDGSPKLAMAANMTAAGLNIVLDWLFVFPFGWGMMGAAFASSLSAGIGACFIVWYYLGHSHQIKLYKPKFSATAIRLTLRNCGYQIRLGLPAFIAETAISCMMIVGNFMFMSRLHEDGVAAFSVACYLFPMIFMFGNSIAQSAMPIISYNYGQGNTDRIRQTTRVTLVTCVVFGLLMTTIGYFGTPAIAELFLGHSSPAYALCIKGLPLFSLCCIFFTLNLVLIGQEQSMEHYGRSTFYMLLRGVFLIIPCFILLPRFIGDTGLWLAVPTSEAITLVIITIVELLSK